MVDCVDVVGFAAGAGGRLRLLVPAVCSRTLSGTLGTVIGCTFGKRAGVMVLPFIVVGLFSGSHAMRDANRGRPNKTDLQFIMRRHFESITDNMFLSGKH